MMIRAAAKPDYLSSIPGTHKVHERTDSQKLISSLHVCDVACKHTHAHTHIDK